MGQQENQIMLLFVHVKTQPGYSFHVPTPFGVCLDSPPGKQENGEHLKIINNKALLSLSLPRKSRTFLS